MFTLDRDDTVSNFIFPSQVFHAHTPSDVGAKHNFVYIVKITLTMQYKQFGGLVTAK